MSRGKKINLKPTPIDTIYKSKVVTRLINRLMQSGKKATARSTVYEALEKLSIDKKEACDKLENAIKDLMPPQEVKSRRIGGATYQVPVPLRHHRAEALAIRWLVEAARAKKGKPIAIKLSEEIASTLKKEGSAYKKKEDTMKMADANKAFAHLKW